MVSVLTAHQIRQSKKQARKAAISPNYKSIFHPDHLPASIGMFGFIIAFGLFSLQIAISPFMGSSTTQLNSLVTPGRQADQFLVAQGAGASLALNYENTDADYIPTGEFTVILKVSPSAGIAVNGVEAVFTFNPQDLSMTKEPELFNATSGMTMTYKVGSGSSLGSIKTSIFSDPNGSGITQPTDLVKYTFQRISSSQTSLSFVIPENATAVGSRVAIVGSADDALEAGVNLAIAEATTAIPVTCQSVQGTCGGVMSNGSLVCPVDNSDRGQLDCAASEICCVPINPTYTITTDPVGPITMQVTPAGVQGPMVTATLSTVTSDAVFSWSSSLTTIADIVPNPNNTAQAFLRGVGPGSTTITVSAKIGTETVASKEIQVTVTLAAVCQAGAKRCVTGSTTQVEVCQNGQWTQDTACSNGNYCTGQGQCVAPTCIAPSACKDTCTSLTEIPDAGKTCAVAGQVCCKANITTANEGEACGGVTGKTCTTGLVCNAGICKIACTQNSQCTDGKVCTNGFCTAGSSANTITLKTRLDSVTTAVSDLTFKVQLMDGSNKPLTAVLNITASSDQNGVFSLPVSLDSNITVTNDSLFNVSIKGPKHKKMDYTGKGVVSGVVNLSGADDVLLAGDLPMERNAQGEWVLGGQDNNIDSFDYDVLNALTESPTDPKALAIADLNYDGYIDATDIGLFMYTWNNHKDTPWN